MIVTPTLPPKSGFVEVEIDGVRQYRKVETEADERADLIEKGLLETSELLADQEAKNTENEQAILELSMLLGGNA
ncbi:MAG: hypothetical protein Q8865_03960 [Bacillota bacterium]|nr:hypothetical protein [Bacillota bacterium]